MIPGFSTRLGWERGWKSCMANSKDWRSENASAIELNCKVVKKAATPPFLHQPPPPTFSGSSPLSSKKFRIAPPPPPQVTQFLEGPNPLGGVLTMIVETFIVNMKVVNISPHFTIAFLILSAKNISFSEI